MLFMKDQNSIKEKCKKMRFKNKSLFILYVMLSIMLLGCGCKFLDEYKTVVTIYNKTGEPTKTFNYDLPLRVEIISNKIVITHMLSNKFRGLIYETISLNPGDNVKVRYE